MAHGIGGTVELMLRAFAPRRFVDAAAAMMPIALRASIAGRQLRDQGARARALAPRAASRALPRPCAAAPPVCRAAHCALMVAFCQCMDASILPPPRVAFLCQRQYRGARSLLTDVATTPRAHAPSPCAVLES
jgi:hypothetical protein